VPSKTKKSSRARSLESLGRRTATREPKERIFIVCEGETEQWYFNYLKSHRELDLATAVVVEVRGGAPIGVVERACEIKAKLDKSGSEDMVWAVFDTERLADNTSFHKAVNKAHDNGIKYVISCPCIEYWLLLHHGNTNASYYNCANVERELKAKVPTYQKGKDAREFFPLAKVRDAYKRSLKFYDSVPEDERYKTTCTDVHRLIFRLFEMAGLTLD
jgi:hypothetical protein